MSLQPFMVAMSADTSGGGPGPGPGPGSYGRPTANYTAPYTLGVTYTNLPYAYDDTGAPPDTTTYGSISAASGRTGIVTFTGMGTVGSTLHMAIKTTTVDKIAGDAQAVSSVIAYYSKDGGVTWFYFFDATAGADVSASVPQTIAISGITGDVQVQVQAEAQIDAIGGFHAVANAYANIYDIWLS